VPTYDYQCRACNAVTEVIHSMLEEGPSSCAECGGELRRILYPTGIIFKGSGFYSTDSRSGSNGSRSSSGSSTTPPSSPSSSETTTSGGDAPKADPKPKPKPESTSS
jgi:putative FmdB family regulatory protein